MSIVSSISPSASDVLLRTWGHDLIDEYAEMVARAGFSKEYPVVELATGSGRMTAVLAHLGYRVITGDLTLDQRGRVLERLTPIHSSHVEFVALDMRHLPFRNGSLRHLACVNTMHELTEPRKALDELMRVLHPRGTLLFADFSERGFEIMERLERAIYERDHPRGSMPMAEVEKILQESGIQYGRFETKLNAAVVLGRSSSAT